MSTLNIRGVPPEVHEMLLEEAAETHRSVTSIALEALCERVERRRRRLRLANVRRRMDALRTGMPLTSDSGDLVREDRER